MFFRLTILRSWDDKSVVLYFTELKHAEATLERALEDLTQEISKNPLADHVETKHRYGEHTGLWPKITTVDFFLLEQENEKRGCWRKVSFCVDLLKGDFCDGPMPVDFEGITEVTPKNRNV